MMIVYRYDFFYLLMILLFLKLKTTMRSMTTEIEITLYESQMLNSNSTLFYESCIDIFGNVFVYNVFENTYSCRGNLSSCQIVTSSQYSDILTDLLLF